VPTIINEHALPLTNEKLRNMMLNKSGGIDMKSIKSLRLKILHPGGWIMETECPRPASERPGGRPASPENEILSRILIVALVCLTMHWTCEKALATNLYVSITGTNNSPPYTNWALSCSNIQWAVNAAAANDTIWVSNGIYSTGTTNMNMGRGVSRLYLDKSVTVRSVNGPEVTIIKGQFHSGEPGEAGTITNGANAVRCVDFASGTLMGFTLTNGATTNIAGGGAGCGGAAHNYTGMLGSVLSNCIITGNAAYWAGGGICGIGKTYNCIIVGNRAETGSGGGVLCDVVGSIMIGCTVACNQAGTLGGGVSGGVTITNCMIASNVSVYGSGGGACGSILYNCILLHNRCNGSDFGGGGAYGGRLYNCLVAGNAKLTPWGGDYGGGTYNSMLYNCTVVGNRAFDGGGGVAGGTSLNCIIYFNFSDSGGSNWNSVVFSNSCTIPTTTVWAAGNITNNPLFLDAGSGYGTNFVAGDYHLQNPSPCINAGANAFVTTNMPADLDGRSRIDHFSGIVDMGCFEYLPSGTLVTVP
jgi:hypothetical protein